ncbi:hypothetical protein BGZ76_003124 [Entomortierella beljakovae]|nr:hypothetical protein BGZ76_003124 [Entomortierella beljakovae]
MGRNHLDYNPRSTSKDNNIYTNNGNSQSHTNAPYRPQRAKRAIPDPNGPSNLTSSVSQLSLLEDHSSLSSQTQSSLPSSPSTVSLTNSFVDVRHLDSGVDIQEPPKPLNKRSNRDGRNIPAEIESPPSKPKYGKSHLQKDVSNIIVQKQLTGSGLKSKAYLSEDDDDDEDYFADILDKYCNSDEEIATPTTPYSPVSKWKGPQSPLTPTIESRNQFNKTTTSPTRLTGAVATSLRTDNSRVSSDNQGNQKPSRSRNNSTSDYTSSTAPPLNAATAKFNMYNQTSSMRNSQESLTKSTPSSSPLPPSEYTSKTNSTTNHSTNVTRAYAKKPPPPPKDDFLTTSSASVSKSPSANPNTTAKPSKSSSSSLYQQSSRSYEKVYQNDAFVDIRDSKPEPPPKDGTRRSHTNQTTNGNSYYGNSRPPTLTLDTHSSGQLSSFSDVVEESMGRHRPSASSPSGSYYGSTSGTHSHPSSDTSKRTRSSSSDQSHSNNMSHHTGKPTSDLYVHQNAKLDSRHDQSGKNQIYGYSQDNSDYPRKTQSGYENPAYNHQSSHYPQQEIQYPGRQDSYSAYGSSSQLDLSRSSYKSTSNTSRSQSQASPYPSGERTRSHSHGSVQTGSSTSLNGYNGSPRSAKSALSKTPIARARAKEMYGSRKVAFGEMITIVTVERSDTPPPPPPLDKKARKKLLQAKKNAQAKGKQPQSFDPEYNATFFEAPYTPTPAEVVVTLAPWIGNPNYDEEKANSKFYYDDDLEYDEDEEYDAQYESDIRLGPDDDDEDDEDEDEEEDEEFEARSWGRGIAGPGGAQPKKKGGMFGFKKAVNRLLRN